MTKKEAQEMLMNTKVYVNGKSKEIQEKLFEIGFRWDRYNNSVDNTIMPFLYIGNSLLILYGSDMKLFKEDSYKEISAEEILAITIEEEYPFKPFDKVLVRDNQGQRWECELFSSYVPNETCHFHCVGHDYTYCIPYEGNEHLVGTYNSPKK